MYLCACVHACVCVCAVQERCFKIFKRCVYNFTSKGNAFQRQNLAQDMYMACTTETIKRLSNIIEDHE